MNDDYGVDIDEVFKVIDAADVLVVRFHIIQKRLLVDYRTKAGVGPMIAVAALNLMGIRMRSVPYGRQMGQVILGSAVSLYFTPPVVTQLAVNLGAIVAATIAVFVVGGLGAVILSRASGVEGKSGFFASIPGGAMAMAVLAERYGAQIAPVAVAHSLR